LQLGRRRQVSVTPVTRVQIDIGGIGCNAPANFQKVRQAKHIGEVYAIVSAGANDPILYLKGHNAAIDLCSWRDGQPTKGACAIGCHGFIGAKYYCSTLK
jgi:hypothetical protein